MRIIQLASTFSCESTKMKRRDLIRLLEVNGWYFKRSGGDHDIYTDGKNNIPIPRHSEIKERLAKSIIKKLGDENAAR